MQKSLLSLAATVALLAVIGCNPPGGQNTARSAEPVGDQSGRLTLGEGESSVDPTASQAPGAGAGKGSTGSPNLGRPGTIPPATGEKPSDPAPSGTAQPGTPSNRNGATGQGPRGGMGMRGMGGMGAAMMLGSDEMKKELKITASQEKELKALMDKAMSQFRNPAGGERPDPQKMQTQVQELQAKVEKILSADQRKRMEEISLQMQGAGALRDADVQKQLGMSAKQVAEVEKIDKESMAEMEKIRSTTKEGERPDFSKFRAMREESNKKLLAVLSASQVQKLEAMKGKPFTMPQRQRGGPGGAPGQAR